MAFLSKKTGKAVIFTAILALLSLNPAISTAKTSNWQILAELSGNSAKSAVAADADQPDMVVDTVFTAYSSTPDQTDDSPFIAAGGKHVYDGMVATNFLPLGTKVKIPELFGDKEFTVDDRMNKRYGKGRADIWMETRDGAVKFGVRRAKLEVYLPKQELAKQ